MSKTRYKIVSVVLAFCMVISCMAGVSVPVDAAQEISTITWDYAAFSDLENQEEKDGISFSGDKSGGNLYDYATTIFTAPTGFVFTKIEFPTTYTSIGTDSANAGTFSVEDYTFYSTQDGETKAGKMVTWIGEENVVSFTADTYAIEYIKFTLKGEAAPHTHDEINMSGTPAPVAKVGSADYSDFSSAVSAWNSAASGAELKLLADVETSGTINVTGTRTLDLNGHGIRMTGSGSVISVDSGANLTLNDSDTSKTHHFTPPTDTAGLATLNEENGTLSINGGYITGGTGTGNYGKVLGGGIFIDGGTVTMNGGTVIGNSLTASDNKGAGVWVGNNGSFTMRDGAIIYNYAQNTGGGVCLGICGDSGRKGTFTMTGGEISHNYAASGSGVQIRTGSAFTMTGGKIVLNTCKDSGGGVDFENNGDGKFFLSGNPVIKDNKRGTGIHNICLRGDTPSAITVNGILSDGADVSVSVGTGWPPTLTAGVFTNSTDTSYNEKSKFKSDDERYSVIKNSDGQLELASACTVTFDANGHGTAPDAQTVASGSKVVKPVDPVADGYGFGGWYKEAECTNPWNFEADTVTDAATLYAKWLIKLEDSFVEAIPDQTYTGNAIEPALTVKNGGNALTAGTDYTAEYSDNTNAGTAKVTITGKGDYAGTAQKTFTIKPVLNTDLAMDTGTMPDTASFSVSGLTEEANEVLKEIQASGKSVNSVNVTMKVENGALGAAAGASEIAHLVPKKKLSFLEVRVEKTIDSVTTTMEETSKTLEIVVPYEYTERRELKVYRYHGKEAVELEESDSKEDGTFRIDHENGRIYIYANKFSTYAIGYTPYYNINGGMDLAGYTGKVQAVVKDKNGSIVAELEADSVSGLKFGGIPKGEYTLTLTWTDGVENSLTVPLTLE